MNSFVSEFVKLRALQTIEVDKEVKKHPVIPSFAEISSMAL
jgi:hypothetical protein